MLLQVRPPPRPLLVLRGVTKTIHAGVRGCSAEARVLTGVDLLVRRGERVALLGAAGSGKTTLLLLAAGLLIPDDGSVWRAPGGELAGPGAGEWLAWEEGGRGTALVVVPPGAPVPTRTTRAVKLVDGRLHAIDRRVVPPRHDARRPRRAWGARGRRVDSVPGAP